MSTVYFIRGVVTHDSDCEYWKNTDIWVFGDIKGYEYLISKLNDAKNQNVTINIQKNCDLSMQCLILSASDKPEKRARVKLVERKIFKNEEPEMELIIYGNIKGYNKLIEELEHSIKNYVNKPDEHSHIEEGWSDYVVKRSVSLNIRGPLQTWNVEELDCYKEYLIERQPTYLPDDCSYMTKKLWKYELPVIGEPPFILR
ncbi:MAG: hypothetical protein COA79_26495 [Planctomycetota bacterium]|nr:MAG: hypothetical protein COA79_26495 [Planctomycetota bacterium]